MSNNSKLLGPEIGYVDLFMHQLEETLKKAHEANKTFQRTPIRPSASGKCARELYFELMQYSGKATYNTPAIGAEQDLLFGLGHAIESHLIGKFRKHFTVAEVKYTQQSLDFGRIEAVNDKRLSQHLEGSLDLILWSDKWKCCVDVKSKGDYYDFKARKSSWDATDDKLEKMSSVQKLSKRSYWVPDLDAFLAELQDPFFEANFRQLNMYLNSSFLKDRAIDHGAIIQYMKNKSRLREIRFRPSETVFNQVVEKFKGVVAAVDTNNIELAPATYDPASMKSRYCDFCKNKVPGSCAMVNREKK